MTIVKKTFLKVIPLFLNFNIAVSSLKYKHRIETLQRLYRFENDLAEINKNKYIEKRIGVTSNFRYCHKFRFIANSVPSFYQTFYQISYVIVLPLYSLTSFLTIG